MSILAMVNPEDPDTFCTNTYPDGFEKVSLPEGQSGDWKIVVKEAARDDVAMMNLRAIRDRTPHRIVPIGVYTILMRGGVIVMSDTPAEAHEHIDAIRNAKGRVLLNGLGIGFVLKAILNNPDVTEIIVVEASPDVIGLVASHYSDDRLTIVQADAFKYQPEGEFDFVWHDIWDDICEDNLDQMRELKLKYDGIAKRQGFWSADVLGYDNELEKEEEIFYCDGCGEEIEDPDEYCGHCEDCYFEDDCE